MMANALKMIVISVIVTSIVACAQLEQYMASQRLEAYQRVSDKILVDAFYDLSFDGRKESLKKEIVDAGFEYPRVHKDRLFFRKMEYDDIDKKSIYHYIRRYDYDSVNDIVAKIYIENAKNRGNRIKLYKPHLGNYIARVLPLPFDPSAPRTLEWYDLDNVMIEYDGSGMPVSCLVRFHQAEISIAIQEYQYVTIYFGRHFMRKIENSILNSVFDDTFIRELH